MAPSRTFKQELVGVFGFPVAVNPARAVTEPQAYGRSGLATAVTLPGYPPSPPKAGPRSQSELGVLRSVKGLGGVLRRR